MLALTAHLRQDRVSGCPSVGGGLSGRDVGVRRTFLRLQWAQAKAPPWVSIPTWGARSPHGSRAGTATHSLARAAPTAASTPHALLTVLLTDDVHGCPPWASPAPQVTQACATHTAPAPGPCISISLSPEPSHHHGNRSHPNKDAPVSPLPELGVCGAADRKRRPLCPGSRWPGLAPRQTHCALELHPPDQRLLV